jgi:hypothetical protein
MALLIFISVIISAPDVHAVTRFEAEDQSVLLIHPNTIKTIQIAVQSFEPVCRRTSEILERYNRVHQVQFDPDSFPQASRNSAGGFGVASVVNILRRFVSERENHRS